MINVSNLLKKSASKSSKSVVSILILDTPTSSVLIWVRVEYVGGGAPGSVSIFSSCLMIGSPHIAKLLNDDAMEGGGATRPLVVMVLTPP